MPSHYHVETTYLGANFEGYIGGSILARLLVHPEATTFHIVVLVRSSEKAEKFKAFGVTPVVGSLEDLDLLEEQASKSNVIFSCVSTIATQFLEKLRTLIFELYSRLTATVWKRSWP